MSESGGGGRVTMEEPVAAAAVPAFWHALPLHYLPYLLATGCLYSQRQIRERGLPLQPRRTVCRRDRALGLDAYVHLSPRPITPLLRDKRRKGWPHALIAFEVSVADLPGAAALAYNPKSWRHREDFQPVVDPWERAALLTSGSSRCGHPSAELLIPDRLPLVPYARSVHLADSAAAAFVAGLVPWSGLPAGLPLRLSPALFPPLAAAVVDYAPFLNYAEACRQDGRLLPPPRDIPFD